MCIVMDGTQQPLPEDCELIKDDKISRVYYSQSEQAIYKRSIPFLIENEAYALKALRGKFAPKLLSRLDKYTLKIEYIDSEKITNPGAFVANCRRALKHFWNYGLRHCDLTPPNILVRGNAPIVIDWSESRLIIDPYAGKRDGNDTEWLMKSAQEIIERQGA